MTSPLRPSLALPVTVTGRPSASFAPRGQVLDRQLDVVDPDLRLARRGQIAIQDLAVADLDPVDARGRHPLERVADVGKPAAVVSSFFARLLITIFGLIQPRPRRQPRVEQLAPVDARRDALRVEQRVLPVVRRDARRS